MPLLSLPFLKPEKPIPIDVHVIWLPDGMSCDGDTISVTAAEQPSIQDLIMGAIPGMPKVVLHNRVLAYEQGGDEFMEWRQGEQGELNPFVLVVQGSIPNEKIKEEGYWTAIGNDRKGQPIPTNEWIDRLAPKAVAVVAADLRDLRGNSCDGRKSDRQHGVGRLSWMEMAFQGRVAHRERSGLPSAAGQHDGDRALPPLSGGRAGADDSAGRETASDLAVRKNRA